MAVTAAAAAVSSESEREEAVAVTAAAAWVWSRLCFVLRLCHAYLRVIGISIFVLWSKFLYVFFPKVRKQFLYALLSKEVVCHDNHDNDNENDDTNGINRTDFNFLKFLGSTPCS